MTAAAEPVEDRDALAKRLAGMYESGASLATIVATTGIPYSNVRTLVRRGGARMRPACPPRRGVRDDQRVKDMYLGQGDYAGQPHGIRQVAAALGLSYHAVHDTLRRAKLLRAPNAIDGRCRAVECPSKSEAAHLMEQLNEMSAELDRAAQELAELRKAISPYVVTCPRCDAAPGDRCRTPSRQVKAPGDRGGRMTETHVERMVEAFYATPPSTPAPVPAQRVRAQQRPAPHPEPVPDPAPVLSLCGETNPADSRIKCRKESGHYPDSYHRANGMAWG